MQTTDVSVFSVLTLWHWVISLTALTPSPVPLNGQSKISLTLPSNEMLFLFYRVLDFMLALYQYFYLLVFWSPLTCERVQRMRLKFPNCKVSKGQIRTDYTDLLSSLLTMVYHLTLAQVHIGFFNNSFRWLYVSTCVYVCVWIQGNVEDDSSIIEMVHQRNSKICLQRLPCSVLVCFVLFFIYKSKIRQSVQP